MRISTSMRWLVVAVSAAMLLAVAAACSSETIKVPGETVVVEKEVVKTVEVPGETVVKEVVKEVMVPGETVVIEKVVTETVEVPGETVVIEKVVTETVEVPGETVTVEVVKTVEVPGQTVVVEKEVVKTVEVPGETVVVTKEVLKVVEVRQGYVTDPTNGKAVSAPQYGGTLNEVMHHVSNKPGDPWFGANVDVAISGVVEKLSIVDWAIDRDTYPFIGDPPVSALRGALAESWDISSDGLTYTFHIRQGVHWHDKAPMNGRELTAKDVEYNYHRMLGNKLTGTQFSEAEPSPVGGDLLSLPFESITATDKWTVVLKLKGPSLRALGPMLDQQYMFIQPPEVIEQHGDLKDWRNLVGTGPFMMTKYVPDSSITWTKNPNYWGFDEKYRENSLPYIDELKAFYILEQATIVAGLRSAKIDFAGFQGNAQIRSIDQADSLIRTNPELVVIPFATRSNHGIKINTTRQPFDDIRVRKAMQMALDLETISATYFKGFADTIPRGLVGRVLKGYHVPFEEWPEKVKKVFDYDPESAEALLDEAELPRGADGIRFKAEYLLAQGVQDVTYPELLGGYWRDIGIQMDIVALPIPEWVATLGTGDWDMWIGATGSVSNPYGGMAIAWSGNEGAWWAIPQFDAQYDAWYEAMVEATTLEEQMDLITKMDMRFIEQVWMMWVAIAPEFNVHQPWVIGYNGEINFDTYSGRASQRNELFARVWIDRELKKAMGR